MRLFLHDNQCACVTHAVCQQIGSFYQLLLLPDTKNSATHWVCGWLCRVAPQLRISEHVSRYFVILGIKGFKIKIYEFLQNSSLIGACEQVSWNLKCLLSTPLVTWQNILHKTQNCQHRLGKVFYGQAGHGGILLRSTYIRIPIIILFVAMVLWIK